MSHASNIENPQSLLFGSRGGITGNAMSWSSRNREINLGNKIQHLVCLYLLQSTEMGKFN